MYAIRQIQTVENGKVVVQLPADFPASQVEVIVLPVSATNGMTQQGHDEEITAIYNILAMDTAHLNEEQRKAYQRTCTFLQEWLQTRKSPLYGAFAGLVEIADDFDAPLPEEIVDLGRTHLDPGYPTTPSSRSL